MKLILSKLFVVTLTATLSFPAIAALNTSAPTAVTMAASNGVKECNEIPKCGLDCQAH